jgi:hypothetical protein
LIKYITSFLIFASFASIIAKEDGELTSEKVKVRCVCKKNFFGNKSKVDKYQEQLKQWFISVDIPPPPEDVTLS